MGDANGGMQMGGLFEQINVTRLAISDLPGNSKITSDLKNK